MRRRLRPIIKASVVEFNIFSAVSGSKSNAFGLKHQPNRRADRKTLILRRRQQEGCSGAPYLIFKMIAKISSLLDGGRELIWTGLGGGQYLDVFRSDQDANRVAGAKGGC
jgi:hypothetical protein